MNEHQFNAAQNLADAAAELDDSKKTFSPELRAEADQCVERMHGLAIRLAGEHVGKIYAQDDEAEVPA